MNSMQDKKICIITSVHKYNDRRILDKEAISLLNNGYEIDLIAPEGKDFKYRGINIVGIPKLPKLMRPVNWLRIIKICISKRYSIIHFHDPDLLFVGLFFKIFTNSNVIYDVHENYAVRLFANRDNWFFRIIRWSVDTFEHFAARIIRNIIVVEKHMRNRFNNYKCHTLLLPNFARAGSFRTVQIPKKDYTKRVIIHTGTLMAVRGSLVMAEIVKKVTDVDPTIQFKFVRNFLSDHEETLLMEKIRYLQIEKQFQFIDWVPPDKLLNILIESSIGLSVLLPYGQYHNRAIPTKLFEYMAAGLAIVAEESACNNKYIRQNRCGYLEPYSNIDRFKDRILDLINNPTELRRCGENGREAFLKYYNWEIYEESFIEFYKVLK